MKHFDKIKVLTGGLALALCALLLLGGASACAEQRQEIVNESAAVAVTGGLLEGSELFTERDLLQEADLSEAAAITVKDGEDVLITQAGVYVLSGSAEEVTVTVEAGDTDKVQLVLDGVAIVNSDFPCIYVKSADKVFVTTTADSSLSVTEGFASDGDTNTDGVIFSRADLVLNGTALLTVDSADHGVVSKDDLKITGGSYVIGAAGKAVEANDSVRVCGGSLDLTAGSDGIHAANDEDDSLGWVYISGGEVNVDAGDDGIHAAAFVQIDGGSLTIRAAEGIEGTYVQINGGEISISSWDDGINAARKSSAYAVTVEITGGELTISMGAGDTDGIDSNGNLIISGGSISITGNSGFDYDGSASFTGGTIVLNGQQLDYIPNQMMGGGMGGFGGQGGQSGFGGRGGMGGFGGRGR